MTSSTALVLGTSIFALFALPALGLAFAPEWSDLSPTGAAAAKVGYCTGDLFIDQRGGACAGLRCTGISYDASHCWGVSLN